MKFLKKLLCLALAVMMVMSLAACSTPKVALTVDGKEYSTGEYLAYMFEMYNFVYEQGQFSYAEQQGMDIWAQMIPYENQQLDLASYVKAITVDEIIRQKAIENLMAKEGVVADPELIKEVQTQGIDPIDEKMMLQFGFNKENYAKMMLASKCNEQSLFLARYDKDGSMPVPEADIRKYFDDNFLSYKMIPVNMMVGETEMTADQQKKVKEDLEKYLKMYKDGKAFNDVMAQYSYDISQNPDKKLEKLEDKDTRQDLNAGTTTDTDLANAIKTVKEGEAKVVTFKSNGTDLYAALVLRLDPEEGEDRKTFFDDKREEVLLSIKSEEFNKEIQTVADALQYTVNQKAYKMCDPRKLFAQQ